MNYLAIGHVTEDVWPDAGATPRRQTPGGTVMYASRAARRLTREVRVFTAAALAFDLAGTFPDIRVQRLIAPATTEFENIYTPQGRVQVTRPCDVILEPGDAFFLRETAIIHLAPVCNEVSPDFVEAVRRDAFVGVTPQGWLRRWDAQGHVTQAAENWTDAGKVLARADAVVTSIEDINGDWSVAHGWAAQTKLLVVTQSELGCTAFVKGQPIQVPAPRVVEVDPTGAGDIFAAALFVALQRGESPTDACAFACCLAAQSVTRPQLEGLPTAEDIQRCSTISALER